MIDETVANKDYTYQGTRKETWPKLFSKIVASSDDVDWDRVAVKGSLDTTPRRILKRLHEW
jgi:hypothetical protein